MLLWISITTDSSNTKSRWNSASETCRLSPTELTVVEYMSLPCSPPHSYYSLNPCLHPESLLCFQYPQDDHIPTNLRRARPVAQRHLANQRRRAIHLCTPSSVFHGNAGQVEVLDSFSLRRGRSPLLRMVMPMTVLPWKRRMGHPLTGDVSRMVCPDLYLARLRLHPR